MDVFKLKELIKLQNNIYFKKIEAKGDTFYILPNKDSHSYKASKEIVDIHEKLEPYSELYDITISFDEIKIKPKSEFYE